MNIRLYHGRILTMKEEDIFRGEIWISKGYIVHIINHGSFHRGQIVTMARTLGVSEGIVNTDYNIFNCL